MNIADERKRGRAAAFTGLLPRRFRRRPVLLTGALAAAAACAVAGCSAGGAAASGSQQLSLSAHSSMASTAAPGTAQVMASSAGSYQVLTRNDNRDLTFNQLLGINNEGEIVGYFGSGDAGHPNRGYALSAPYSQGNFKSQNFPRAAQTQVIGINDEGVSVGFFSPQNNHNTADNANFAFWRANGRYHEANYPTTNNSKPQVDQLLGVNDTDTAVGFYNDSAGNAHGYAVNLRTGRYKLVTVRGATSVTATAIDNEGVVAGFFTSASGAVDSFLQAAHGGRTVTLTFPGASMTQAFGVNDGGEVVGAYTTGTAANAVMHGFTWENGKFTTVDYPMSSATTINGVNNEGDIVGFYTDAKGNTDGFVGLP